MKYLSSLLLLILASCSSYPSHSAGDATNARFEILGVHIGLPFSKLTSTVPTITCQVSCGVQGISYLGMPGNLFVGIGESRVNQLAFRFVPTLSEAQAAEVRAKYVKLYGASSSTDDGCDVWEKTGGRIVLCVSGGLSMAHWDDPIWGKTRSVIPG